ncbi:hypothetical protein G9P44_004099 [Scheffersomyces stipitis]|nr:hypothetical protein G9P44_004099 [Scheffersomyces stipitis]
MRQDQPTAFVNSFWGKNDMGFLAIQTRMRDSIQTLQELLDYYQERMNIEKDYSKRLDKLNSKYIVGTRETGALKKSLDKLMVENKHMVQNNEKFVKSINHINYDKINDFYRIYTKKVNRIESHMSKLIARKNDAFKSLEITKAKYQHDCSQMKSLRLSMQTTWGKELEKHEAKYNKLNSTISASRNNYQLALTNYRELNDFYKKDWAISLQDLYKLEIERIQTCKVNCFNFCNNIATLCVDNDQALDLARSVFAQIQPPKDLSEFSLAYGTGNKIYNEPKFVDFMSGQNESQDKEDYTIANGQDPEPAPILSRSYSTYSQMTTQVANAANKLVPNLPPPGSQNVSRPNTPSPTRKAPTDLAPIDLRHTKTKKSESSGYSSIPDDNKNDVFSINEDKAKFGNSNGSANSNYSSPTNYSSSNYSTGSGNGGKRNWASPRRTEKQLSQFQEQINRKSKELPSLNTNKPRLESEATPVPIMKDFSIDFIAKALEDLNSGGNGDVNQFRRSVRRSQRSEANVIEEQVNRTGTELNGQYRSASDYVDDHDEVAIRYGSINFSSPAPRSKFSEKLHQQRPKSMIAPLTTSSNEQILGLDSESMKTVVDISNNSRKRHSLSSMPSKSYTNQGQAVTPVTKSAFVTKARARYSYKPQQHGELFFKKGWNMYVIHKQEDNWYLCELASNCLDREGVVGLVPGNYLVEGMNVF